MKKMLIVAAAGLLVLGSCATSPAGTPIAPRGFTTPLETVEPAPTPTPVAEEVVAPPAAPEPEPVAEEAVEEAAPVAPGPILCPPGTQANSSDGFNDTSCLPDVCYTLRSIPDPAYPECDYAYPPENY